MAARRAARGRAGHRASVRVRPGRLLALCLALVAVAMYAGPLRDFFAQQDRYHGELAALAAARAENAALKRQAELLATKDYIAQRARVDGLLVPPGSQVFVVKGLPDEDEVEPFTLSDEKPVTGSVSVLERVEDLWRTILD